MFIVNPQRFCALMVNPATHAIEAVREYAAEEKQAAGWFLVCRDSDVYVTTSVPMQSNPHRLKHGYGHVEGENGFD